NPRLSAWVTETSYHSSAYLLQFHSWTNVVRAVSQVQVQVRRKGHGSLDPQVLHAGAP
ncbi:unnamed protein product, partial [Phaeothamnion confervicola]